MRGPVVKADPLRACEQPHNKAEIKDKIVIIERGDCMFIEKVKFNFLIHYSGKTSFINELWQDIANGSTGCVEYTTHCTVEG